MTVEEKTGKKYGSSHLIGFGKNQVGNPRYRFKDCGTCGVRLIQNAPN